MGEANKSIRLSKAVKEFNLSMDHILGFLASKGIQVEPSLNSKLPEEAYDLLLNEFQKDKSLKEKAQLITQTKIKRELEPETVVAEKPVVKKSKAKEEEPQETVLIKDVTATDPLVAPPAKTKESKKSKSKEPSEPEVIRAKAEPTELKILGKMEIEEKPAKRGKKKEPEETKTKTVKTARKKKPEEPVELVAEKEQKKVEAATEIEEPTPAVTGDAIQETEVRQVQAEETSSKEQTDEKPKEVLRIKAENLTGPKFLGKIDLPVEPPKKKPVASSTVPGTKDEKKKRKRTDRKAGGVSIPEDKRRFEPFQRKDRFRSPHHRQQQPPKPEVTEKEIKEQIKNTLEQLTTPKSKGQKIRKLKREERELEREVLAGKEAEEKKIIKVTEFVSANELAKMMNVDVGKVISTCMSLGMMVSINQRLDGETLAIVAEEFGYKIEFVSADVLESINTEEDDKPENQLPRAPIVTVMGHVDHGKTSLLDYIRKANVIAGEAGGITQHIGAYEVTLENGKKITFLDTPGHEAFTAMRARGAKVTDVAIIVIAADDNVMPQTIEAINHAQAANVPIVFAFNKIDKPDASTDKLKEQLSKMNILVEDWGGKYQSQEISAKKGLNIDMLLEKVLLEADLLDLKANPNKNAQGTVIESMLDKGRGFVMTVLVQSGTLRVGDVIIAGCYSGRVKALFNEREARIKEAGPSTPVIVLGMTGAPQAGDVFNVMEDEREARDIANKRFQLQREQGIRTHKHITLDEIGRRLAIGNFKELNVIVKGDVDGSIEALSDSLLKLSNQEIQINVIHKSVGQISESDVLLASASNAIIIGFQVRPSPGARRLAEAEEIEIRLYSIIYKAIEEVKQAMEGMLAPEFVEKTACNIEVREIFKIPKVGTVAGCMVLDGKVQRNTLIRLVRDGIVVYTGELSSLKRFKDDVKEVGAGYECGLSIHNFNDIKVGDIIEGYEQVAVKRTLV